MKKLIIFISVFIFAYEIDFYSYSVKMLYQEYSNTGDVIDKDYTNFGDLNGIGIKLSNENFKYVLEYARGESIYKGMSWGGENLETKQKNVYIFNTEFSYILGNSIGFLMGAGYRIWNRGKSNYEGDYNEIYYWPYFKIGMGLNLYSDYVKFVPEFAWLFAINPKLQIDLLNKTTLNLSTTTGAKLEIPFTFCVNGFNLYLGYKFVFWYISGSESKVLKQEKIVIYEPRSITTNHYIEAGISYNF